MMRATAKRRVVIRDAKGRIRIDTTGPAGEMNAYAMRWRHGIKTSERDGATRGWTVETMKVD